MTYYDRPAYWPASANFFLAPASRDLHRRPFRLPIPEHLRGDLPGIYAYPNMMAEAGRLPMSSPALQALYQTLRGSRREAGMGYVPSVTPWAREAGQGSLEWPTYNRSATNQTTLDRVRAYARSVAPIVPFGTPTSSTQGTVLSIPADSTPTAPSGYNAPAPTTPTPKPVPTGWIIAGASLAAVALLGIVYLVTKKETPRRRRNPCGSCSRSNPVRRRRQRAHRASSGGEVLMIERPTRRRRKKAKRKAKRVVRRRRTAPKRRARTRPSYTKIVRRPRRVKTAYRARVRRKRRRSRGIPNCPNPRAHMSHIRLRKPCPHCSHYHTKSQHRSHGSGSFYRVHKKAVRKRKMALTPWGLVGHKKKRRKSKR